jgi:hypothetical protein
VVTHEGEHDIEGTDESGCANVDEAMVENLRPQQNFTVSAFEVPCVD